MTDVRFLPPAAKFIKKLKDKKLKMLYQEAVDKMILLQSGVSLLLSEGRPPAARPGSGHRGD